jgi:hypothetical protein
VNSGHVPGGPVPGGFRPVRYGGRPDTQLVVVLDGNELCVLQPPAPRLA